VLLNVAIQTVQKKSYISKEKRGPFECGFNSIAPSHIPFSFQFFLVALLFLIFDVEIAIVMSYPIETIRTKNLNIIFLFLATLVIGLIYE
jgi:NADH-ubiquinone oxidoreductase chain 3